MPSIGTLVADLASGAVAAVGAKPPSNLETGSAALSTGHAVRYSYVDMKASLSATNRLSCAAAESADEANGRYLHFQDNWATVCKLDVHHPLVVSGNFSGCAYQVFKTNTGELVCAHIARPAGHSRDANVTLMGDYGTQKGWTEIQSIPTAGRIGTGGCTEVMLVSQLIGNRVDSILLAINNGGMIVGSSRTTTTIP